jgi:hypothetical protein
MCFYIEQKNPTARVALENIKVYKFLVKSDDEYYSPYIVGYRWHPNKLQETKLGITDGIINQGFHAYISKEECEMWKTGYYEVVCKMIIPKGATYYINEGRKEIVSNQMILKN